MLFLNFFPVCYFLFFFSSIEIYIKLTTWGREKSTFLYLKVTFDFFHLLYPLHHINGPVLPIPPPVYLMNNPTTSHYTFHRWTITKAS